MVAYYNEIDPYAAQWLRNLIDAGLTAKGEVDTRSIVDVRPGDLVAFQQCHFFAGLGGWSGALRLAGFPDDRPVWTGSCPCQPFSLAGKQKGFDDERHLWPVWRELIRERRPAKVYGEQVASASEWLRLVRGDLEAMDYAMAAIPCEAASAGADHLRDRYWFVGDSAFVAQREPDNQGDALPTGWEARAIPGSPSHHGFGLADADDARPQGRQLLPERASERIAGPDGLANSQRARQPQSEGGEQHFGGRPIDSSKGHVSNAASEQVGASGQPRQHDGLEWVIGADGKARRVKSGIRLLAHGVPARVAKLRALGNAIDLRPAAAFIRATM